MSDSSVKAERSHEHFESVSQISDNNAQRSAQVSSCGRNRFLTARPFLQTEGFIDYRHKILLAISTAECDSGKSEACYTRSSVNVLALCNRCFEVRARTVCLGANANGKAPFQKDFHHGKFCVQRPVPAADHGAVIFLRRGGADGVVFDDTHRQEIFKRLARCSDKFMMHSDDIKRENKVPRECRVAGRHWTLGGVRQSATLSSLFTGSDRRPCRHAPHKSASRRQRQARSTSRRVARLPPNPKCSRASRIHFWRGSRRALSSTFVAPDISDQSIASVEVSANPACCPYVPAFIIEVTDSVSSRTLFCHFRSRCSCA